MGIPKEIHVLLSARGTEGHSSIFFLPVLKIAEFQKFLNVSKFVVIYCVHGSHRLGTNKINF